MLNIWLCSRGSCGACVMTITFSVPLTLKMHHIKFEQDKLYNFQEVIKCLIDDTRCTAHDDTLKPIFAFVHQIDSDVLKNH